MVMVASRGRCRARFLALLCVLELLLVVDRTGDLCGVVRVFVHGSRFGAMVTKKRKDLGLEHSVNL